MKRTSIGWTDFSSNPVKFRDRESGRVVWACVQAADECRNCYAEALGARWGKGHPFTRPNLALVEPFLDDAEIRTLLRSRLIRDQRLFLGDMTDIFGDWVPDAWLDQIFAVFAARIDVTWQILTKRPKRLAEYTNDPEMPARVECIWRERVGLSSDGAPLRRWPLSNVHGGTSAGSQRTADLFIPDLLNANLAVRWLSAEPLIAPVAFGQWQPEGIFVDWLAGFDSSDPPIPGLDWVAVGGESGAHFRPMDLAWLAEVVEQCQAAGVPVYVKQDSGHHPGRRGRIPDALWIHQFPEPAHQLATV